MNKKMGKSLRAVEEADIKVGHKAAGSADYPLVRVLGAVSELADQPPLIALSLATAGVGLARADRRLTRTGGRMLASHVLATAMKALIKRNIDRARPGLFASMREHRLTKGERNEGPMNSFPSGHTAGALAVSRAVVREYPERALPAYGATAAVAAVQLPRGAHFPIDIVVGAAIGWAAEALVYRLMPDPGERIDQATRAQAAVTALTPR